MDNVDALKTIYVNLVTHLHSLKEIYNIPSESNTLMLIDDEIEALRIQISCIRVVAYYAGEYERDF